MSQIIETAIEIAHEAGTLLERYFLDRVQYDLKGESDLVTVADKASEKLVVQRLKEHFPDHSILAEEGGGHESDSAYRWYVDPLDGTTNFAHGYPVFNVTLGLEKDGEMIAGVVYDPDRRELFSAEKGSGAYLNGRRIRVSRTQRMADSLVCTGFPARNRDSSINIYFYHQLGMTTHGVRRSGSAAVDLANVSCGRLEAFWEFGLNPWDLAAGKLLVAEAGGTVTEMRGAPHTMKSPDLLVSNGAIHQEMLGSFGEIFSGKPRFSLPPLPTV